jgi:oligopeptide transport system substrate-binding protein
LHLFRAAIPVLLAVTALCGCKRETDVDKATREGILLVGNSAEPRGLDLQLVSGVPESRILASMFEGLVGDHPSEDNTMTPGVATRWEHNEDLTEWTFHLRPEAKWSDGTPLTADDFHFSYHRMLHPVFAAAYAQMLHVIRNAEAYNRDERGHILCGLDASFPIPWETLRHSNFHGKENPAAEKLMNRGFESLDRSEKTTLLAAKGLDRMKAEHLQALLADPTLFEWPANIQEEPRTLVVRRLLDHIEAGEPDLFKKADIGIHVVDPHTLVFNLREPVPYLPSITRHTSWLPVPRHVILKHGKMTDRFTKWSSKENLVCNGAFKLHEWRYNHFIEVRRNPYYWDAKNVGLNGIRFYPIDNPYTETRSFLAGQLHTTFSLPAELLSRTRKEYPQYLRTEPYVGTVFLRFNTTRPGLDNPKVRQALSLAVNRAELCKYIYEGFTPATGLTPKLGDYQPLNVLRFDLDKAKALLAEAGYPGGEGLPPFTLLSSSRPTPSIDALQASFRKLGVRITVEQKDWGSFIATQQELNYDISIGGWIGDYLDATTFLDLWTRGNGNSNSGWSSPEYEALLRKAAKQADPVERTRILAEAEALMLEAAPIIPIAWYSRLYLHRPEVKGWHPLVLDNHPWDSIRLEPGN